MRRKVELVGAEAILGEDEVEEGRRRGDVFGGVRSSGNCLRSVGKSKFDRLGTGQWWGPS